MRIINKEKYIACEIAFIYLPGYLVFLFCNIELYSYYNILQSSYYENIYL